MADDFDAYKILQVDSEAEDEVIQAAYRRLARKYHPDLVTGPEPAGRMAAINAAWALLGTRAARVAYDRSRAAASGPAGTGTPAPHRPTAYGHDAGTPGATGTTREAGGGPPPSGRPASPPRPPETVSRDWTSGRSTAGGGFDPSMRSPEGLGAAGPPPGRPSGSVLNFGRYSGWSLGEIARRDLEYIEWLDRMPIGRTYRDEIDAILRAAGRRRSATTDATERRGLFRRR
ncbi:MAG: J domain-containing protein [Chloroflexi bacterium]|nr:J domain-containing protein [Chloroflexota bacterium]